MYSRTCPLKHVNKARQSLFAQGTKRIENIPQAALLQHINRAGHVWGQTLLPIQELPRPSEWGCCHSEDGWVPFWSELPEASKACAELIRCGCKKGCQGNCKCIKADLPCSSYNRPILAPFLILFLAPSTRLATRFLVKKHVFE